MFSMNLQHVTYSRNYQSSVGLSYFGKLYISMKPSDDTLFRINKNIKIKQELDNLSIFLESLV